MTGLTAHLQSKHPAWPESKCRHVAEKIMRDKAERDAAKKVKLAAAQLTFAIGDEPAGEEKNDPTEPDDPTVDF
jgi:hypothetical protein